MAKAKSSATKTRKPAGTVPPKPTEPEIRVLKRCTCQSMSGRSVTYSVGIDSLGVPQLQILGSAGGGFVYTGWTSWSNIKEVLDSLEPDTLITGYTFAPLYSGRSANNFSFLQAILISEKVLIRRPGRKRGVELGDSAAFLAKVEKLAAGKTKRKPSPRRKRAT